ncbi:DUF4344 domain-containing metallopeptidase [Reichenbachiella sp.]|uniref:DUF4344 domain-containing metallopeptidase n=1 Tax=Reichenbachiella sp. TaxID=2184521 RepID=UPI00329A5EFA
MIRPWLFTLFFFGLYGATQASKLSIKYKRPNSDRYLEIFRALKSNHNSIYGESTDYLKSVYRWPDKIEVMVTTCDALNSSYTPDAKQIVICYESLYQKINDYPENTNSDEAYERRVFQNVMFTFWHEIGHALMDQYGMCEGRNVKSLEMLADEFAILSMLWREEDYWKGIVMISALHYKSKSERMQGKNYESHPSDELRYQKMIVLLYGFAQKSYAKLKTEVDQLVWLDQSAHEYYLGRSAFWEENLRNHTRSDFFNY